MTGALFALDSEHPRRFADVTVVVPTYNEAPNVPEFLRQVERHAPGCTVVFADDDSRDGTRELARSHRGDVHVHVLHRKDPTDRGLTASVADAILWAQTSYVVVMDADLQHPPRLLPALLEALEEGEDLVVATRSDDASFSVRRRILSRAARTLARGHIRRRVGVSLGDPMSGFFAARTELARRIVADEGTAFQREGFKILMDLVLHAPPGLRFREIPYVFQGRHAGASKLTRRHYVSFLRQLGPLGRLGGGFLEVLLSGILLRFLAVGASGVLVNEGLLYALHGQAGVALAPAALVAIEASVLWNFAFNNAWTFEGRGSMPLPMRLARFHVASALGILVNLLVVLGGVMLYPQVSYLLVNLVGIALGSGVNFLVNLNWTWGIDTAEGSDVDS